ncbi:MAG: hypothetical protein ACM3US_03530 [Sphingomonadaceae bacterium]
MTTAEGSTFSDPEASGLRAGSIAVHLLGEAPPVRFAAEELLRYLPRLLPHAELDVYLGPPDQALPAAGLPRITSLSEGAILVHGNGRRYAVAGAGPSAVLHAAYAFLEALGARWIVPGPRGEAIRPHHGPPPALELTSVPAFPRRGLVDGCLSWWPGTASFDAWLAEMGSVVDWMGKMRMNRLFVHFNRLPPGDLAPLLPKLERRGIALELGGHNLPKLLPAGAREEEPELCRLVAGVRRPDGNFCTATQRALDLLKDGARRYVEQLPPADLYHFWPYDAKDDPWCGCPDCRSRSTGEQMWRAIAAAAEGLAEVRPGALVSALLYHESLGAATHAPLGARLLFAPRERCYLHPIDGDCPRNRGYMRELRDAIARGGEALSLLEYYGDPILLGRPANRAGLVASDLAAYGSAGVRGVSTLVFGALSWWLYPVQLYGFARGSWDPASAGSAVDEFARAVAGETAGDLLSRYYRLEGEAAGTHLRFCGYAGDGAWATLPFPPSTPEEEVWTHRTEMERGALLLREAGSLLERAAASCRWRDPLPAALLAHRLEEAIHRAVQIRLAGAIGEGERGSRDAFADAVAAMEEAPPDNVGVFGVHWMLPWLRRCRELGHEAPL